LCSADLSKDAQALTPYGASSAGLLLAHPSRCDPSPCRRLSRPQSTMATLTADRGLRGFQMCCHTVTSALLHIPDQLSHVPIDGLKRNCVGGGYRSTCTCYCTLLSGHGVYQVCPCHPFDSDDVLRCHGTRNHHCIDLSSLTGPSGKVLSQGCFSP
jgi:hypothetical protein